MVVDPFAVMAKGIFRNPHFTGGCHATYQTAGGDSCAVYVIKRYEDEANAILTTGTRQGALAFDLLVEDVPVRPSRGDMLIVEGITYRIKVSPPPDSQGHVWLLDVEPV